ncbi:MAG TPA: permease [Candidatus Sulfomarinibacteraceae bacterium]|nr:permease [Candidatus Sulfomarinibacteraceae bacterium]
MWETMLYIVRFVGEALLGVWPYLLLTIPIAVAVNLSGASRHIERVFQARPLLAIVLATAVGAFSPFCSCTVIPVVASLLIGGVPLAPVMSFWIASPSMDPETFFLSVAMLDWDLALWRLGATFAMSLGAGFVTHALVQRGWLGEAILRSGYRMEARSGMALLRDGWRALSRRVGIDAKPQLAAVGVPLSTIAVGAPAHEATVGATGASCGLDGGSCAVEPPSWRERLWRETWAATSLVLRFMLLAFFLEALIALYVPEAWIVGLLGRQNPAAIVLAALLGVPVYTSNLTALPLIGGLLGQGMSPAAALAFLMAGPTTTLPAMAAVWGLVRRRVFVLYVAFALVGAVVVGYVYQLSGL